MLADWDIPQSITFLLGAGVSTECGIPDFRSEEGLFIKYGKQVFEKESFLADPLPLYKLLSEFEGMKLKQSLPHVMLKKLCDRGVVRRIYTQNIDGLEKTYGIPDDLIVRMHGAWPVDLQQSRQLRCHHCKQDMQLTYTGKMPSAWTEKAPTCYICGGILQPNIVLYGDDLSITIHNEDKAFTSLLVVMGTSLLVAPASVIPSMMHKAQKVWINKDPPPHASGQLYAGSLGGVSNGDNWDIVEKQDIGDFAQSVLDSFSN